MSDTDTSAGLTVGQTVPLHLDSLAVGGEAVGRHEGMAVFAMWGCPGDEVEVEITEVAARFARGVVKRVVSPSPDRVEPKCPHFGECGGCQWQHISYPAQLRHKAALVREALTRIGRLPEVEVVETVGMERPWGYRGRTVYRAAGEGFAFGFTRHHSHDAVVPAQCPIQHPLAERVRAALADILPRVAGDPADRAAVYKLEVGASFADERAMALLVCEGRPEFVISAAKELMAEVPEVTGVCAARQRGPNAKRRSPAELVAGNPYLTEQLGEGRYRVSPDSFFQVNPRQGARLAALVEEWAGVKETDVVVDAYCGVGAFLLPLARRAKSAIGIESDESAIGDARANVRAWRRRNVKLYRGRVEHVLPRLAHREVQADIVVLDPPRKGCGAIVCEAAAKLGPRRILLVSCHPATLARDLRTLTDHGYAVRRLQPVDMFPHTWHVEAVALCERL